MPEAAVALAARGRSHRLTLGVAALVCIAVQLPGSLLLSALALALWLFLLLLLDRGSLARLWLPRFWLLTLVFALGSGLLLGPRGGGVVLGVFSAEGLRAGLLMVLRGAFIFGLASWASRAVGGEQLQRAFGRVGLRRLGTALSVAMELLPELRERLQRAAPPGARRLRGLRRSVVELVVQAARLADEIALRRRGRLLAAVIGSPRSGKTTQLTSLAERLGSLGVEVGGVVQPAIVEGERVGRYELLELAGGEKRVLARRRASREPGGLGFDFEAGAFEWAREQIARAGAAKRVVIVDELGKLEARGEGHLPALREELAARRGGVLLLGVREECAAEVQAQLGAFDLVLKAGASGEELDSFAHAVEEASRLPAEPVQETSEQRELR